MKRRNINPQEKIDQVRKVARKLFLEKGFHAVSIRDIVDESGVSTGAIYLHFNSKDKLATCVYQQTNHQFLIFLKEKLMATPLTEFTVREILYFVSEVVFELTETDPDVVNFLLTGQQNSYPNSCPLSSTRFFRHLKKQIRRGMASGEIKPGNDILSASAYYSVIQQAVELRLNGQIGQPLPEIGGEVFENAWSSIKAN